MRTILAVTLIAFAAPVLAASNPEAEKAIRAVVAQIDTCLNSQDAKCLGELFTEDGTFAGPLNRGEIISGKATIVRMFGSMLKDTPEGMKQVRTVEQVRFLGEDRALVDSSVKLVNTNADNADAQNWHSAMLMRSQGGKWLLEDVRFYVVVTGSPPTPGPTAPPTAAAKPDQPDEPAGPTEGPGKVDEPGEPGEPAPPSMG